MLKCSHLARDWRALALTQVHHGSRLSDSCEERMLQRTSVSPNTSTGTGAPLCGAQRALVLRGKKSCVPSGVSPVWVRGLFPDARVPVQTLHGHPIYLEVCGPSTRRPVQGKLSHAHRFQVSHCRRTAAIWPAPAARYPPAGSRSPGLVCMGQQGPKLLLFFGERVHCFRLTTHAPAVPLG